MQELDTQGEWQRLYERYHAMSDGELLTLAAGIGDLTEVAGDVLRQEMRDRRLQVEAPIDAPAPASKWPNSDDGGVKRGDVALMVFYDAIDAGRACEFLEEREIDFEMQDVSKPRSMLGVLEMSPPVSLRLVVRAADRERAMAILRETMGLFPLQEVEVADEAVDDGAVNTVGNFGRREDAEDVARVLEDAGIWHQIVANPEGTVENEDCYALEVREIDLVRAGEVVERGMELPES